MRHLSWLTGVLVLANASLVLWGTHLWRVGEIRVHEPERVSPINWEPPQSPALEHSAPQVIDFASVRDQAVFYASRRFYTAPPPVQTVTPPSYELTGVVGFSPDKRSAILHNTADQASRRVHVGDDLDGWLVRDIDVARVLVTRDAQTYEIRANGPLASPQVLPGVLAPRVAQASVAQPSVPANTVPVPNSSALRVLGRGSGIAPLPPGASPSTGPAALLHRPPPR